MPKEQPPPFLWATPSHTRVRDRGLPGWEVQVSNEHAGIGRIWTCYADGLSEMEAKTISDMHNAYQLGVLVEIENAKNRHARLVKAEAEASAEAAKGITG